MESEKCSRLEVSVNISTFTQWGIELHKLLRVLQRGLWPREQGLGASEKRMVNLTSSSGVLVWTKMAIWSKAGLRSPTDLINIECFRSLPRFFPYLLRVSENYLRLYNIILKCGVGRHKICQHISHILDKNQRSHTFRTRMCLKFYFNETYHEHARYSIWGGHDSSEESDKGTQNN